ncbi:MAG TPA: TrmH family RNA methyltransferase [Thermoanaerobaculia bacterium]
MGFVVVLVRTHSPGNLGSASRAAKCFGASFALLDPRADRSHPDALAFSSGAEDLLADAPILTEWEKIGSRADRVVALSSLRGRSARGLPPATSWSSLRAERARCTVALVFGPERGGLTREELERCDARISLPTSAEFPTLNLAQAVAASLALGQPARKAPPATTDAPAPSRDLSRLLDQLHQLLASCGYPGKGHSDRVLAELDSFVRRGRPSTREVTLLLGALAAIERRTSDR